MSKFQMVMMCALIGFLLPVVFVVMCWFALLGNFDRFRRIALALDCAGNGAMNGDFDETISSRSGRKWPRMARFINWLFNDQRHCESAIQKGKT
jgi:hypothetical protein